MKKSNLQKYALILMIIVAIIFIVIAYINQGNNFWLTIAGGVATGALMAATQYFVSMSEHKEINEAYKELHKQEKEIQKFKDMGVKKVLPARDDPEVYGEMIEWAKDKIWVMGNTSSRLLEDFANKSGSTRYKDVLLNFLERGGEVKILISERRYLFKDKDKQRFNVAKIELTKLSTEYEKFNFAYFKHIPTHSIFVFDDHCLLGPIFDNLDSKATPALAMDTNSEYAQKYLNYFNAQWATAMSINDNKN